MRGRNIVWLGGLWLTGLWLTGLCLCLTACDDTSTPMDGGIGTDANGPGLTIAAPAPAVLPRLTPCPDGWAPVFRTAGVPECDPLPEDPGLCSGGRIVPGQGCVSFGRCPSDGWPEDLPGDALYVDADAVGGDGSQGAPFTTLEEALAAVGPGGTIALRIGSHNTAATLDRDITLRGACQDTILTSDLPAAAPSDAVLNLAAAVTVEDLSIRGASRGGIQVAAGARATLHRISMFGVSGFGVGVLGELTAEDLSVDGVGSGLLGGGRGLTVEADGVATVIRTSIEDTSEVGVFSSGTLSMEDTSIIGSYDPDFGFVFDAAPGVSAEAGGSVSLTRTLLAEHSGAGARASGGGSLVFEDVVVRGNREEAIRVSGGSSVDLTRCVLGPGHPWGVLALDSGTQFRARDLLLTGAVVRGVSAGGGAQVVLRQTLIADVSGGGGVLVDGMGGSLVGEDLTVRDTDGDRSEGRGIGVQNGATADLERIDVARARGSAVGVFGTGSPHRLVDVTLRETRSARQDGRGGSGLIVSGDGVAVDVQRAALLQNRGTALVVDQSAAVTLTDVRIANTQPQDCASVNCEDEPGGTGMGAYRGGAIEGSSFVVEGSPLCGLQVAEGGQLDLRDGRVTDGLIGACVQIDDFDVGRIEQRVLYVRNERNLDSSSRTIPASQLPSPPDT